MPSGGASSAGGSPRFPPPPVAPPRPTPPGPSSPDIWSASASSSRALCLVLPRSIGLVLPVLAPAAQAAQEQEQQGGEHPTDDHRSPAHGVLDGRCLVGHDLAGVCDLGLHPLGGLGALLPQPLRDVGAVHQLLDRLADLRAQLLDVPL